MKNKHLRYVTNSLESEIEKRKMWVEYCKFCAEVLPKNRGKMKEEDLLDPNIFIRERAERFFKKK